MTVIFNVPGSKRKELAKTIAKWLGTEASYAGAPSFAYHISDQVLERDGKLITCGLDDETCERLLQHLYDEGFESQDAPQTEQPAQPDGIAIQIPLSKVSVGNLTRILDAKGNLIRKALGIDDLGFAVLENRVDFPWFPVSTTPDELKAYMHFITAICEMSTNQKRINATEKEIDNEKYAFRCFLLRLGFIGDEYKAERKILLRNLSGSSAFKGGSSKEVKACEN